MTSYRSNLSVIKDLPNKLLSPTRIYTGASINVCRSQLEAVDDKIWPYEILVLSSSQINGGRITRTNSSVSDVTNGLGLPLCGRRLEEGEANGDLKF